MTGRGVRRVVVRAPGETRGRAVSGIVHQNGAAIGIRRDGAPRWFTPDDARMVAEELRLRLPAGCTVTVQQVRDADGVLV